MKYRSIFVCPKCENRYKEGWGTVGMKPWSKAIGHCHGCGFTWKRSDDWKYFVRIGRYASRAEFKRLNKPRIIRFYTKRFFGNLPIKAKR